MSASARWPKGSGIAPLLDFLGNRILYCRGFLGVVESTHLEPKLLGTPDAWCSSVFIVEDISLRQSTPSGRTSHSVKFMNYKEFIGWLSSELALALPSKGSTPGRIPTSILPSVGRSTQVRLPPASASGGLNRPPAPPTVGGVSFIGDSSPSGELDSAEAEFRNTLQVFLEGAIRPDPDEYSTRLDALNSVRERLGLAPIVWGQATPSTYVR